jgi:ZIP family zinc transporter
VLEVPNLHFLPCMKDTKLGVAIAIAIALHNIPEGIAVATPVYFATGSKLKALLWTLLSALSEPLGGVIGWLIAGNGLNSNINDVLFDLVVGMMVTISIKELIPTAYCFCAPGNKSDFLYSGWNGCYGSEFNSS